MITQIQGKLVEKNPTQVVVDCNGIGYEINISLFTFSSLSSDENIKLFTHLQVKEDAHILYGFFTPLPLLFFCNSHRFLPVSESMYLLEYFS